jgi:hypothetical protein
MSVQDLSTTNPLPASSPVRPLDRISKHTAETFPQPQRPDVPLDVVYVVSCHLAGMNAFGTLASLHLANHHVAETLLPVLYETLLLDDIKRPLSPTVGDDAQKRVELFPAENARHVK